MGKNSYSRTVFYHRMLIFHIVVSKKNTFHYFMEIKKAYVTGNFTTCATTFLICHRSRTILYLQLHGKKKSLLGSSIWYLTTWATKITLHRHTLLLYCILSLQCLSRDNIYSCKRTKVHVLDLNGKLFFIYLRSVNSSE